jgi:two-component system sensor histidine kinase YesM
MHKARFKDYHLKWIFFRTLVLYIIIPIVVIFFGFIRYTEQNIYQSSKSQIELAQDNIVSELLEEINSSKMNLSQIAHYNNGEILDVASNYLKLNDPIGLYHEKERLNQLTNLAIPPTSHFLACSFIDNNQKEVTGENRILSVDTLQNMDCYKEALDDQDTIKMGIINFDDINKIGLDFSDKIPFVFCYHPHTELTHQSLEMVSSYIYSDISNKIISLYSNKILGAMCIVDQEGNLLTPVTVNSKSKNLITYCLKFSDTNSTKVRYNHTVYYKFECSIGNTNMRLINVISMRNFLGNFIPSILIVLLLLVILFVNYLLFYFSIKKNALDPIADLVKGMQEMGDGNLTTEIEPSGYNELKMVIRSFNDMKSRIKKANTEEMNHLKMENKLEIQALQSQINPHFLVNTLESIKIIAHFSRNRTIEKMLKAMVTIVSTSFRNSTSFYSIEEELEIIKSYIYLMCQRNNEEIDTNFSIQEEASGAFLPRLILQPIVENSIIHGFDRLEWKGILNVSVKKKGEFIYICIEDNGKGMNEECQEASFKVNPLLGKNIGLSNVKNRLNLIYGDKAGLEVNSKENEGTKVILHIPFVTKIEEQGEIKSV